MSAVKAWFARDAGPISLRLPNGMRVWVTRAAAAETRFIYREIFEDRCYEQQGIAPAAQGVVLDVGANVGLFALRMKQLAPSCTVYCFEPVPATYACLEKNVAGVGAEVLNAALSDRVGLVSMTFFPRTPGNSTLYPEGKPGEVSSMADTAPLSWVWQLDRVAAIGLALAYPLRRIILRTSFRHLLRERQTFTCATRTLDDFIAERRLDSVDLLKIDVEGAERDVMNGLSDENLARVRQLIIEVSPDKKAWLHALRQRLSDSGFTQLSLHSMLRAGDAEHDAFPCVLYAKRDP
ncbi:MAG TPA: FkbM family methyltransferase [Polyangiales bacterium]